MPPLLPSLLPLLRDRPRVLSSLSVRSRGNSSNSNSWEPQPLLQLMAQLTSTTTTPDLLLLLIVTTTTSPRSGRWTRCGSCTSG